MLMLLLRVMADPKTAEDHITRFTTTRDEANKAMSRVEAAEQKLKEQRADLAKQAQGLETAWAELKAAQETAQAEVEQFRVDLASRSGALTKTERRMVEWERQLNARDADQRKRETRLEEAAKRVKDEFAAAERERAAVAQAKSEADSILQRVKAAAQSVSAVA
jgi:chromosome segregation ATPase